MADTIHLRAGNEEKMPTLADREPAYVRDKKALYIGTPEGNVMLCTAETLKDVENLKKTIGEKLTANQATPQTPLDAEADLAAVVSAYNALIAALKTAGIMGE